MGVLGSALGVRLNGIGAGRVIGHQGFDESLWDRFNGRLFVDRAHPLVIHQVSVGVKGQHNGGVTHQGLDGIRRGTAQSRPRTGRVPQDVEVQLRPRMIPSL